MNRCGGSCGGRIPAPRGPDAHRPCIVAADTGDGTNPRMGLRSSAACTTGQRHNSPRHGDTDRPMPAARIAEPLTDQELDRLDEFLNAGPATMNLEAMDGYFTALICGPITVSPSEAWQQVLGDDLVFDSNEQATEIIGLMMRHWNWIAAELQRTLTEEHAHLPVLLEDEEGMQGNDWAHGFMRGVQARPGSWNDLLNSEDE